MNCTKAAKRPGEDGAATEFHQRRDDGRWRIAEAKKGRAMA